MLVLATVAMTACGGGDDGSTSGAGGGNTGTTPTAVQPLAGGALYVGAVSFGDTVSVELDKPAAGQLTLRFLDSRYGLAGTLTGQYTVDGNTYRVSKLAASGSDVPAALAAAAASITFSFTIDDGLLSGALGQVPNVAAGNGALLQGYVSAANKGAQLADIAGTYSYLRQAGDTATAGQLNIQADGTVRVCAGQGYSAACTGGQTGQLSADADQSRYPGAYALTLAGSKVGRLFVGKQQGNVALFVDETGANASAATGNWVVRSATPLATNAVDGDWLCAEPELDEANALTGRTRRNIVSVAGNTLAADNIPVDVALAYNTAASVAANGLISGNWQETVAEQPKTGAMTWLPVSTRLAYQLRQVPGTQRMLPAVCAPLPAPTPIATYLSAKANDIILVTLADLRPTQPAIGRDQIYYKLGRYAADPVKRFDDVCEANGQSKTSTSDANSRIDTLASFTCTKTVGNKPADMKTLVVGPYGEPYLTDGHHTFTSLWEAVSGGSQSKVYVRVQDNLSTLNRATFFRTLRERKLIWSKDGDNRLSYPADLPRALGLNNGLGNDPYRALVYFTRDIGYQQLADATEFTEFYWGDWLRKKVDVSKYDLNSVESYLSAVRAAATAMVALAPTDVVSNGKTAAALGRLATFNETEFTALSQPLGTAKPGKLPYAVDYRTKLKQ
nr:ParB/Srx family N-terminal domain-containing protein [uncultured Cupriavidus sp.]